MLKIISGQFRSRRLVAPPEGDLTRPYLARVRKSVFGMLHGWFEDASVLDLFAGVGTVGLEAVSRGASHVVMVEHNKRIYDLLKENIDALGCRDQTVPIMGDALGTACLHRARQPVDLAFIDPPYSMMQDAAGRSRVIIQITRCRPLMENGFVILRSPLGPDQADLEVPGFAGPEAHQYGPKMWVLLYQPVEGTEARGHDGTEDATGRPSPD